MNQTSQQPAGFLRLADLINRDSERNRPPLIPVSAATLWRWVKRGLFPRPVKLSERVTAWRAEDVQQWMSQQGHA
jgi:prophage regulatory protein